MLSKLPPRPIQESQKEAESKKPASLFAIPLNCFLQELSIFFADLHKAKTRARQDVEIRPNDPAHHVYGSSRRTHHQAVYFIQCQLLRAMNVDPPCCDVPHFPIDRAPLRYHRHRPLDVYAREFSLFLKTAQCSSP